MRKYYYNSYRGFANEFSIISVEQTDEREVKQFGEYMERYMKSGSTDWDLHPITAKRAREIIATERATARSYLKAGLNLTNNPVGATDIITATEFFLNINQAERRIIMTVKELRTACSMTQKAFSEMFKIPKRTIEDWEAGRRKPPEYVLDLIAYKLSNEGLL